MIKDWRLPFLLCILFLTIGTSLSTGAVSINAVDIPVIFFNAIQSIWNVENNSDDFQRTVVLELRSPRVLLGLIVGAVLGVAGASFQALFRNPLADPSIIGVSAGAATGAIAFIVLGHQWLNQNEGSLLNADYFSISTVIGLPLMAMLGALLAAKLLFILSGNTNQIATLLLAGIAVNALFNALNGVLIFFSDEQELRELTFWSLGSLGRANIYLITPALVVAALVFVLNYRLAKALNAFSMGEAQAFYLGHDVDRVKRNILLANTAAVGAVVALSGVIGFIGLVVPHISRMLFGANNQLVIPASAILGAILVLTADVLSRTIVLPAEMPLGVITGLIGAPFFIYLLTTVKNRQPL